MEQTLYILIRNDIPVPDQAVQAGHAVAEWCKRWKFHGNTGWENSTLIYLSVPDIHHIKHWKYKLNVYGEDFSTFIEPDIKNEETAIACMPLKQNIFSKLPLWDPRYL